MVTVRLLLMYFGFKLPSEIIPMRIDKFMSKLSNVVLVETSRAPHP